MTEDHDNLYERKLLLNKILKQPSDIPNEEEEAARMDDQDDNQAAATSVNGSTSSISSAATRRENPINAGCFDAGEDPVSTTQTKTPPTKNVSSTPESRMDERVQNAENDIGSPPSINEDNESLQRIIFSSHETILTMPALERGYPSTDANPWSINSTPGAFHVSHGDEESSVIGIGVLADEEHPTQQNISFDESSNDLPIITAVEITDDQVARMEEEIRHKIIHDHSSTELDRVREQLEEEIRDKFLHEAPEAQVAVPEPKQEERKYRPSSVLVAGLLFAVGCLIVGPSLFIAGRDGDKIPDLNDEAHIISLPTNTMDDVRTRGVLRCGILFETPVFAYRDPENEEGFVGLGVDMCRALSIIIFGTPDKAEIVELGSSRAHSIDCLENKTVDILTDSVMQNMERDVYDETSHTGLTFSTPYYFAEAKFMGVPEFVDCADKLDGINGLCRNLKVCASAGSVQDSVLDDLLPGSAKVRFEAVDECIQYWNDGTCNVLLSSTIWISEATVRGLGYSGPFKQGERSLATGPIALVTREDDAEWSHVVDTVVNSFFIAEAANISKTNAEELIPVRFPDDSQLSATLISIISELGNYADLYERHASAQIPIRGMNDIYEPTATSERGLLFTYPFGNLDILGAPPSNGGTLESILERDFLRCGVRSSSPATIASNVMNGQHSSEWLGLDVEVCRAVAAALFAGKSDKVVLVEVNSKADFISLLDTEQVDLIAGSRITLEAIQTGGSFSRPYFYHFQDESGWEGVTLMTGDTDSQWSDFVFWVVNALIYAEEHGITQDTFSDMPVVSLFGENLKLMFLDCISTVGNYKEMYNRTMESVVPREASANMLMIEGLAGPRHLPVPFS